MKPVPIKAFADCGQGKYERHVGAILSFPVRWRWDKKLMALLFAIAYYNPFRKSLNDREKIWQIQNMYYNYFKHYLSSMYPDGADIDMAFKIALHLMGKVKKAAKDIGDTLGESPDVTNHCPLIAELLSYKE